MIDFHSAAVIIFFLHSEHVGKLHALFEAPVFVHGLRAPAVSENTGVRGLRGDWRPGNEWAPILATVPALASPRGRRRTLLGCDGVNVCRLTLTHWLPRDYKCSMKN